MEPGSSQSLQQIAMAELLTDTHDAADKITSLDKAGHTSARGSDVASAKENSGDGVHPGVFRGISGSLKHVQHALGDDEATSDINECEQDRHSTKGLRYSLGNIATAHDEHATNTNHT